MARFLLVHGSGHGAWCWRALAPRLRGLGHEVSAIDLPGAGEDTTPLQDVSLDAYAQAVLASLREPTVVVGHSAAGFAITQAAEIDPANITRLIYLCAYVPAPGQGLADMRKASEEQPLDGALELSSDKKAFRFRDHALAQNLYGDCPEGTIDDARPRLAWQPIAPQTTPVGFTGKGAGIPKSYVVCQNDRTIPPAHQRHMAAGFDAGDVHQIGTGHSPFFADPDGLATLLDRLA